MLGRFALFGLLLSGSGKGCDPAPPHAVAPKELRCTAPDCVGLFPMDSPQFFPGAERVAVSSYGPPCRIEAAWPLADAGGLAVHVVARVDIGEMFPLRGEVAELDQCQDMTPRFDGHGGMFPPMVTIGLDDRDLLRVAPAPKSVPIPVRGEASIEGIVAQAAVPTAGAGHAPVVDVSVGDASWSLVTVHRALHAGDTFAWGAFDASIVRIVAPDAHFVGWVEVAVAPRDARDAATRAALASTAGRDAK
jgi:hypothetical protein